ncbi:MAG: hypothetical protein KR126chlam4_00134 [Candidatus Anoxychlamydiales bacterium]|nr:hypothetical protein [Candidatus Anoxychlamydiales bacterium]HEU64059.1 hypothetical protein [Chlamydiota bacterium]
MNIINNQKAASYAAVSIGSFLTGSAVLYNSVENSESAVEFITQMAGFYLLAVGFVSALTSYNFNKN